MFGTKNDDQLKRDYEKWAGVTLVQMLGLHAEYVRHGDDQYEPDTIFDLNGKHLGIEISTAYYSQAVAMRVWQHAHSVQDVLDAEKQTPKKPATDPDQLICDRIQDILDKKSLKTYEGVAELWLCIVEDSPLTPGSSLKSCLRPLVVPEGSPFAFIYILHHIGRNAYDAIHLG